VENDHGLFQASQKIENVSFLDFEPKFAYALVYRKVENNGLHFVETNEGDLFTCCRSLIADT